jgi:hypothetical protein
MAKSTTKAPTHEVFHVVDAKPKARWTKIGVGWENQDGKGITLAINYTPMIEGRTLVRAITAKAEDSE